MSPATWPPGPGVVTFPNGASIRGRGLRHRHPPAGPQPEHGVYLLARAPRPQPWSSEWVRWPDLRLPCDPERGLKVLARALDLAATSRVEIACHGGRGRTGTAVAAMAVMAGVDPVDAVAWVRGHLHPRAVETPGQRRWIERLDPSPG